MRLVTYLDAAGNFDYERYRRAQIDANHNKINSNWVYKPAIQFLSKYVLAHTSLPLFAICHGTRRGNEQAWFREYLGDRADVIGTEISDTATQFPHTVQHDFHELRDEWVGRAAFIYSNSWDHAYDPAKALRTWVKSLRPDGFLILEYTSGHNEDNVTLADPFGIGYDELCEFVNAAGGGEFFHAETLTEFDFVTPKYLESLQYLIIRRNSSSI
jgi:SAM-dependent methyltransferase